jgi:hypothetical protein
MRLKQVVVDAQRVRSSLRLPLAIYGQRQGAV